MAAKKKVAKKKPAKKPAKTRRSGTEMVRCDATVTPSDCRMQLGPVPTLAGLHHDIHDYMQCMCVYLHNLGVYIDNLEARIQQSCCPDLPSPGPNRVPKPPPPPF